jgi:general stress protein 26
MEKDETKQKVKDFIAEHPAGVLSTVGSDSAPYSTTIYFVADTELNIYFLSKSGTKKIENIKDNKQVMLVAFEAKTQTNLQISGSAQELKDGPDSQNIFQQILEITRKTSGAEVPPVSKLFAGPYAVYKIEPKQINYSVYNQKDLDMAVFETIKF